MSLTKASFSMITGTYTNVKDFGATGDGLTNDASAVQAALTAATGLVLFIPPGSYKLASGVTVPAGTTIMGYGATLNFSTAGDVAGLTLASNVKVFGLTLVGPTTGTYAVGSYGMHCYGTAGASPTYITGPTIEDCVISGFSYSGIFMSYINVGKIARNKVTNCGYSAIQGVSCNRLDIEDNYISTITPGTSGNAYGIAVDRNSGTLAAEPRSYQCKITGNRIDSITVWEGIDTHAGDSFLIANNTITNCKRPIVITSSQNESAVEAFGPKNIVIDGNVINGMSTGSGITLDGINDAITDYAENCVISNNVIWGGGISGDVLEGAIKTYATKGLVISGNALYNSQVNGINVYKDNFGFSVTGNTIYNPQDASNAVDSSCIALLQANNSGYIGGNTFIYDSSATGLPTNKVANFSIYSLLISPWDIRTGLNAFNGNTTANAKLVQSDLSRTYVAADTSPSVANTALLTIANSVPVSIIALDDGVEGQVVTLFFIDGNTTLTTAFYLAGATSFVSSANDMLTLRKYGSSWYETGRSVN